MIQWEGGVREEHSLAIAPALCIIANAGAITENMVTIFNALCI